MDGAAVEADDGGRAPARRRVEVPGASDSERGNRRLRDVAERIEATGAARNARQPGDGRSPSRLR